METMLNPRKPKIFVDDTFAAVPDRPSKYICYGSVICHSFYEHIKNNKSPMSESNFKDDIEKISAAIDGQKKCEIPNILKLYPVKIDDHDGESGYLLIDEKNGCFPLFFYPHQNVSGGTRLEALKAILEKIRENNQNIFNLLTSGAEWKDIQPTIIDLMDHKYNNNQF